MPIVEGKGSRKDALLSGSMCDTVDKLDHSIEAVAVGARHPVRMIC